MNKADWGDLPKDIVRLIMEKLVWSDRFRMCLCCNNWQECLDDIENTQEFLPWVMSYDWPQTSDGRGVCKLYDPAAEKYYTVKEAAMFENRDFCGAIPCHSRNGWVLFSKVISNSRCFFFYSPFTNDVIELPRLEKKHFRETMFSSSPTTPDCMVIAFSIPEGGKLEIQTCQPGEKSWKMFEFSGEYKRLDILNLAYTCDSFYCIFSDGKMGAFNIKQQEWKVFSEQISPLNYSMLRLVFACDGDILLCYWGSLYIRSYFSRFDISKTKWFSVDEESMKKQVTFTDCSSYSLSVPAVVNAKEYAGEIFYYFESKDYKFLNNKLFNICIHPPFQKNLERFQFASI